MEALGKVALTPDDGSGTTGRRCGRDRASPGAEGATAPETLRPKDHVDARILAGHLESDAAMHPPTG